MGDIDFVMSRAEDPGWVAELWHTAIELFLAPPSWLVLVIALAALGFWAGPWLSQHLSFVRRGNVAAAAVVGQSHNSQGGKNEIARLAPAHKMNVFQLYSSVSNFTIKQSALLFEDRSITDEVDDQVEIRKILIKDALMRGDLHAADNPSLELTLTLARTNLGKYNRESIDDNTLLARGYLKQWAIKRGERPRFLFEDIEN